MRLIHWAIALALPASWWTAEEGYYEQHQWLGLTVLVLVLTRLTWGFAGSPQARFADFLHGPGTLLAYLRGAPSPTPGHSPLGALSVVMLWLLLLLQVFTGTVNTDDVLFTGPFRYVFDTSVADQLASFHETLFWVIVGFVVLHLCAIVYYERIRDQRLLRPMINGAWKDRQGTGPARPLYMAALIAGFWALVLWGLLEAAPKPAPSYW